MPISDIGYKFIACRIDISEYFEQLFLDRCGGKVYLSGFFDDNLNTYICSSTPTVYVHALELVPKSWPEDKAANDELFEDIIKDPPDDDYFNRSMIDSLRERCPDDFKELDGFGFDEDDDPAEVVREYLQGNPEF